MGGGDGAGGQELVEKRLGAITGCGLETDVQGFGAGDLERVGVVRKQMTEVECVRGGLGDSHGADSIIIEELVCVFVQVPRSLYR